ncbi:MAG: hypothetical protein MZU95_02380 [Desulfomicrobium escambiense]|nr:hypothetical protein [Desulfomicrobium escambiense]
MATLEAFGAPGRAGPEKSLLLRLHEGGRRPRSRRMPSMDYKAALAVSAADRRPLWARPRQRAAAVRPQDQDPRQRGPTSA